MQVKHLPSQFTHCLKTFSFLSFSNIFNKLLYFSIKYFIFIIQSAKMEIAEALRLRQ